MKTYFFRNWWFLLLVFVVFIWAFKIFSFNTETASMEKSRNDSNQYELSSTNGLNGYNQDSDKTSNNLVESVDFLVRTVKEQSIQTQNGMLSVSGTRINDSEASKKKAVFAIVDDDCRKEAYTVLKPILEERNIKGTFACVTSQIGDKNRLTESQMREMIVNGHEFISHTHTHRDLQTLTKEELHEEFLRSKEILQSLGQQANHLAYPYGSFNKFVVEVAQEYFDSAMVTDSWLNQSPVKTYAIGRIGIGAWGNRSWDIIKSRIDRTIEVGGLGVIMTHVGDNTNSDNELIEQTIDYILSQGYEIMTYSEAFDIIKNPMEFGEFNEANRQFELVIGSDGTFGGNYSAVYSPPANTYTNGSPLREFKKNTLTINVVETSHAQGLPNNTGGTLITYNFGSSDNYAFQIYEVVSSNEMFFRRHGNNGWGEWLSVNPNYIVVNAVNSVTASTPLTNFQNWKITYTKINNKGASGFPENKGGLLTTNRISGDQQFA